MAVVLTEKSLFKLLHLSTYEYFGQVKELDTILQDKSSSSNTNHLEDDERIQWSYQDKPYVTGVLKLFNELARYTSNDFKCGRFVLYIDLKEKNAIKLILSLLKCAEVVDCGSADYWMCVDDTPFWVIEFKTKPDLSGSIGDSARGKEQQFKMKQIPIDPQYLRWLVQEGQLHSKYGKPLDTLEGAVVNMEMRDGFRVKHTQCVLHSIMHLLKCIKKVEEFFGLHRARMMSQPRCTPLTFRPLAVYTPTNANANANSNVNRQIAIGPLVVSNNTNNNASNNTNTHYTQQQSCLASLGQLSSTRGGDDDDQNLSLDQVLKQTNQQHEFIKAYGAGRKDFNLDTTADSTNTTASATVTLNDSPFVIFCRMLMVIPGMTDKKAIKIASLYPNMKALMDSCGNNNTGKVYHSLADLSLPVENHKRKLECDKQVEDAAAVRKVAEVRRLGDKLAEKTLCVLGYNKESFIATKKTNKRQKTDTPVSKNK